MSVIEFSTPYIAVADMLLSVALVIYVAQSMAMYRVIKKHKLEHELDKFENLFYFETATVLTLFSFLMCHFVQEIFINGSIITSSIVGAILGFIAGVAVILYVKKKVRK